MRNDGILHCSEHSFAILSINSASDVWIEPEAIELVLKLVADETDSGFIVASLLRRNLWEISVNALLADLFFEDVTLIQEEDKGNLRKPLRSGEIRKELKRLLEAVRLGGLL